MSGNGLIVESIMQCFTNENIITVIDKPTSLTCNSFLHIL